MKELTDFQKLLVGKEFSMSEKEMKKIIPSEILNFDAKFDRAKKVSRSRKKSSYLNYIDNIINNKALTLSDFLHEISTNSVILEELVPEVNLIVNDKKLSNKLVFNFILERKKEADRK